MPDYCKLTKNGDQEYECHGCQIIGTMFKKWRERKSSGANSSLVMTCKFHNDFTELERCAKRGCATCRVFQRALWLRQITKQEADRLGNPQQQDRVWARLQPTQARGTTDHSGQTFLEIGIGDHPPHERKAATISCTLEQGKGPVNLDARCTNNAIVQEAKRWLKKCHGNHNECKNLSWSRRNPSYLVKIKSRTGDLRLVKTSNKGSNKEEPNEEDLNEEDLVEYAALSYSWGDHLAKSKAEKARVKSHKTTEDLKNDDGEIIEKGGGNLKKRRKSFSAAQLPPTIQDVIKLTWDLGICYIWIDAMCIPPGVDWNHEASKMHEVYGNAHVTLAICSSEMTTDGLLPTRQAWQHQRDACRLFSGYWLSNLDMPLNEIRLQSPLFTRAWTLQEERLSPRMIYVSGQRIYWSCSHCQHTEMGGYSPQRLLEGPDTFGWMRHPQEFLATHRNQDVRGLQEQWLELVKAYAKRDLFQSTDRFPAFSGLAVRYISLYEEKGLVKREEYLAGLWRQTFAQGLAWSVEDAKHPSHNLWSIAPTWSWGSVPLRSDIITQPIFEPIGEFELLEKPNLGRQGQQDTPPKVVERGALVRSIKVRGLFRRLLHEGSVRKDWEIVQAKDGRKDEFDFSSCIADLVHSWNLKTGRIVASEPHKREVVGQLDYLFSENKDDPWHTIDMKNLYCLQIGKSSMLLLMKDLLAEKMEADDERDQGREAICKYYRVGICNTVRELFFALAELKTLVLV